jgi:hypothetical protein
MTDSDYQDLLHRLMSLQGQVLELQRRVMIMQGTLAATRGDSDPVQIFDEMPRREA